MASERTAAKYPVKKNDMVMVITGRERGKTGKVLKVIPGVGPRDYRAAEYREAPFQAARRGQSRWYRREGGADRDFQRDGVLRALQRAGARGGKEGRGRWRALARMPPMRRSAG